MWEAVAADWTTDAQPEWTGGRTGGAGGRGGVTGRN